MIKRVFKYDSTNAKWCDGHVESWVAERDYTDEGGHLAWNHWYDDPDYPEGEGSKSGQEKACADANGTMINGNCNCG